MIKGYIRPVNIDDAKLILNWRNQDFVRVNMYNNHIISYDEHMKWFNKMLNDKSSKYFIYEREQEPIGVISFYEINLETKKASWAFYLGDEKFRGAGVEMEQLALDYAFSKLGLYKLYCEVLSFNSSVIEFHKKFGFRVEGIKRKDYYRDGCYYDIYQLALLKDDYQKVILKPNIKLPKTYVSSIVADNGFISQYITKIVELYREYPGREYVISDMQINILCYMDISGILSIKGKVIYQSEEQVKIEFSITKNENILLIIETLFIRKSYEN